MQQIRNIKEHTDDIHNIEACKLNKYVIQCDCKYRIATLNHLKFDRQQLGKNGNDLLSSIRTNLN